MTFDTFCPSTYSFVSQIFPSEYSSSDVLLFFRQVHSLNQNESEWNGFYVEGKFISGSKWTYKESLS